MQSEQSYYDQNRPVEPGRHLGDKSIQCNSTIGALPADRNELDHTTKLSITEQQIQSHSIIKQLLNNCRYKVVHHSINNISPKIQLYRKRNHSNLEVLLKIEGEQHDYKDSSIYNQIMHEMPIKAKMQKQANRKNNKSQNIKDNYISLPSKRSASIAVSGLISYNFTSVKARHRLAYNTQASQKELTETLTSAKSKADKKVQRTEKIHMKTDPISASQQKQLSDAIIGEYSGMNTDDYLNALRREKENNKFIYGQKLKYLKYLTNSMRTEGTDQNQAEFMINQLKLASRPTPKHKLVVAYKRGVSNRKTTEQQHALQSRKVPFKHKKAIITFIQNN